MQKSHNPPTGIDALFKPRSVALIGVSDRSGSYGHALAKMCRNDRFVGKVFSVNPRLAEEGKDVFPSIRALPEAPDHTVISVSTNRVEAAVDEALLNGTRALTIFAQCPEADMRGRFGARVREAGAVLCGPNSMGLHDIATGLRLTPFPVPLDLKPGGIGLISQSGSVLGALVNNGRRLQFSQVVSTGSESVTTAADYLSWMVERSETLCVGMFLETVRDPKTFIAAMERAAQRDIPVVIMKVGRSELGARMAVSHTGAIVGNDAVFRAMVKQLGGKLVESVDEMAALLAVFSHPKRSTAKGLASIHDSGGERELIADLAEAEGVAFATFSNGTRDRIQAVLEDDLVAENPLDAWGTGRGAAKTFEESAVAMMDDPAVGLGFYVLNWRDNYPLHQMHEKALLAASKRSEKPLIAVSNYAGSASGAIADRLGDARIPMIGGIQNAMRAARSFLEHSKASPRKIPAQSFGNAKFWIDRLSGRDWISEAEGYALFADYGINVPHNRTVRSADEAVAFSKKLTGSAICKTAKTGVTHKTDVGGIIPHLKTVDQIANAYELLSRRLSPEVLISEMLPAGEEWSLGTINDPDFGPAVRIAPGGTLVELLDDAILMMAPFSADEARDALSTLRASKVLMGYRGRPALAIDELARTAAALSRLAWDLRDHLDEIEINPVIVSESIAGAADAVVRAKQ